MSTLLAEQTENVELNARQEALEERVLLLCPTMGWWKGMYQLPKAGTEVTLADGEAVDKDDITTPRAKLMTDTYPLDRLGNPWKKRFQKLESRMTALKEKYSVPFPIQGVRIVPKTRGQTLMNEMYGLTLGRLRQRERRYTEEGRSIAAANCRDQIEEALRIEGADASPNTPVYDQEKSADEQSIAYELHVAAKEFCANWDDIREQIRRKNNVFSQVEAKVPTNGNVMLGRFHIDVVPVELAGGLTNTHRVTDADLEEHNEVVREACRRRVEEAIETMIEGPRQQLAKALASLNELIAHDRKVTAKSFKPVHEAIAKIRAFDFVANRQLLEQMNELESRLNCTVPVSLDSVTAANNGFTAAINSFMTGVQDAQVQANDLVEFGREARAIDID